MITAEFFSVSSAPLESSDKLPFIRKEISSSLDNLFPSRILCVILFINLKFPLIYEIYLFLINYIIKKTVQQRKIFTKQLHKPALK